MYGGKTIANTYASQVDKLNLGTKVNEEVKVSSFGEKSRKLEIDNDFIRFQGQEIRRDEVTEIMYWISLIEFYRFPVGRRYHIGLKTKTGQLDLIFKSYFSLGNTYFNELCSRITDIIWNPVILEILDRNADILINGGEVTFSHCKISKEGIWITKNNALTKKQVFIDWADLIYEKKYDRIVLNSKSDHNTWTNLYFKDTWNIDVLISLLNWITKDNGLAELQK